mmetsp:Transcript_15671/g.39852  ORF Transcript_15671/g.39852 Transcript_15671/m.39852 type:complete len:218 (-) Transcript_15671:1253-1906(-)
MQAAAEMYNIRCQQVEKMGEAVNIPTNDRVSISIMMAVDGFKEAAKEYVQHIPMLVMLLEHAIQQPHRAGNTVRDSGRSRHGSPCMLHERGEIAVPRALVASPHVLPIAASDNYSRRPPAAPQCKRMRGGAAQLLRWPPTRVALVWLHLNQRPAARAIDSVVIVAVVVTAAAVVGGVVVALVGRQPQLESPAIEAALGSPLDSATKTGGCERVLQLL